MNDSIIIGLVTFVAALVGLIAPLVNVLIKVNKSLTTLNVTLDNLEKEQDSIETRVKEHGEELDTLKVKAENHEVRIGNLENR